jgi:hypothetical protein
MLSLVNIHEHQQGKSSTAKRQRKGQIAIANTSRHVDGLCRLAGRR